MNSHILKELGNYAGYIYIIYIYLSHLANVIFLGLFLLLFTITPSSIHQFLILLMSYFWTRLVFGSINARGKGPYRIQLYLVIS